MLEMKNPAAGLEMENLRRKLGTKNPRSLARLGTENPKSPRKVRNRKLETENGKPKVRTRKPPPWDSTIFEEIKILI